MRTACTLACLLLCLAALPTRPAGARTRLRENTMPVFFDGVLSPDPYPRLEGRGRLRVKNGAGSRHVSFFLSEPNSDVYHLVWHISSGTDSLLQGLPPGRYRIIAIWGIREPSPDIPISFGPREYRLRRKLHIILTPNGE